MNSSAPSARRDARASSAAPRTTRRDLWRVAGGATLTAAAALAASRKARAVSTDKTTEPIYMSATKLGDLLRAKQISATEAVQAFIKRQLTVNDRLNAVVTNSYERALAEARALDDKAARNEFVGPLHGVPMTIKDSLDTAGVISTGASVEDLTLITPIISGPDYRDASCAPVPWRDPANVDLKRLNVAFCVDNGATGPSATLPEIKDTVRQAAAWLEPATRSVTEDAPMSVIADLNAARSLLTRGDAWAFYKRLADKWGSKNFSPSVSSRIDGITPLSSAEYVAAWEMHDAAKARMLQWMSGYDVFLCPVAGKTALPIDQEPGAPTEWGGVGAGWQFTGVFNSTGWPVVVVRCGASPDGKLPIGVQVIAAPWREDICLAVAAYLEQRSGGWQRPPI